MLLKPLLKHKGTWYVKALLDNRIDYWNFNIAVTETSYFMKKKYVLFAFRTLEIANDFNAKHIIKANCIYYGLLVN